MNQLSLHYGANPTPPRSLYATNSPAANPIPAFRCWLPINAPAPASATPFSPANHDSPPRAAVIARSESKSPSIPLSAATKQSPSHRITNRVTSLAAVIARSKSRSPSTPLSAATKQSPSRRITNRVTSLAAVIARSKSKSPSTPLSAATKQSPSRRITNRVTSLAAVIARSKSRSPSTPLSAATKQSILPNHSLHLKAFNCTRPDFPSREGWLAPARLDSLRAFWHRQVQLHSCLSSRWRETGCVELQPRRTSFKFLGKLHQ